MAARKIKLYRFQFVPDIDGRPLFERAPWFVARLSAQIDNAADWYIDALMVDTEGSHSEIPDTGPVWDALFNAIMEWLLEERLAELESAWRGPAFTVVPCGAAHG